VDDDHQRRHGIDVLMAHYERLWGLPEGAEPGVALPIDENLLGRTQVFCMEVEHLSAKRRT
jgi:nitroimidazol reductase NimA-like FMN-containing flavoprotein (pyridoxamine 5'-phosphate oxidase superfamily)